MAGNLTHEQLAEINEHWEDLLAAEWHDTNRKPFDEHRRMCRWFFEMGFCAGRMSEATSATTELSHGGCTNQRAGESQHGERLTMDAPMILEIVGFDRRGIFVARADYAPCLPGGNAEFAKLPWLVSRRGLSKRVRTEQDAESALRELGAVRFSKSDGVKH